MSNLEQMLKLRILISPIRGGQHVIYVHTFNMFFQVGYFKGFGLQDLFEEAV